MSKSNGFKVDRKGLAKLLKREKKSKRERFPFLLGCYIDEKYNRRYTRKYLQGVIELQSYKGAVLLTVLDDDNERPTGAHQIPSAWLRGEDFDALIAMLRDAKRTWIKAYRKAERELAKERATRKAKR